MAEITYKGQTMHYQQAVSFFLYKISKNGAHPIALNAISEYADAQQVPQAARPQLLRDLAAEVRARELLGDAAYFGTSSLIGKVMAYEDAMNEIIDQHTKAGTRGMRLTWAEFQRMIHEQLMKEPPTEPEPVQERMQGF